MKIFKKTLLVASVALISGNTLAYDQAWNGWREDISSATRDKPAQDDKPAADPTPEPCKNLRSPVYAASGFFHWPDTDITLPVRSGLKVKRTYNSQDLRVGLFGRGWMTAQEEGIARTWKAITEGNPDGSPKDAESYKSVPIWLAESGRRYTLEETEVGCDTPAVLSFTITKLPDGRWKAEHENSKTFEIFSKQGYILQRYDDRIGINTYYSYDDQGKLIREYDGDQNSLSFSYNDKGLVSQVEDHSGRVWNYEYDDQGRLTNVASPEGAWRRYAYQEVDFIGYKQHLLTEIYDDQVDPLLTVHYSKKTFYNEYAMRVTQYVERQTGEYHVYHYRPKYVSGVQGLQTTKTTRLSGNNTQIERQVFDSTLFNLSVVKSTNTTTNTTVHRNYNDLNKLTTLIDKRGHTTQFQYDEYGYQTQRIERANTVNARTITTEYLPNSNRIDKQTIYGEREIAYTYDDALRVIARTETDLNNDNSRSWAYSYHPNTQDTEGNLQLGQLAAVDGPQDGSADTVTFTYDNKGHMTNIALPEGLSSSFQYNALGLVSEVQHINGSVAKFTYDGLNRPVSVDLNGNTTTYTYNLRGLVIGLRDALNRNTEIEYDSEDRITKITYADGSYSTLTYQDISTTRKVIEALYSASGSVLVRKAYTQDARTGHLVSTANSDNQTLTAYTYNNLQDLTNFTEEGNGNYQYGYTGEGLVSSTTTPLGQVTSYAYDALNRLTQVTAPNGAQTSYSYNGFGEVVREDSVDRGTTEYKYDTAGNLSKLTRANGKSESYIYDALNRLKSIDYVGSEYDAVLSYDQTPQGKGALSRASNTHAALNYDYDLEGRITDQTQTVAGVSYNQAYAYNAGGERTTQTYPSGLSLVTSYDETGRIESLNLESGSGTTSILNKLEWQGPLLKSITYGNGITETQSFDRNGRLIARNQDELATLSLSYTLQSNIATTEYTLNGNISAASFTYDALNRLTQEAKASSTDTYSYDANGNRLTKNSDNYLYSTNSNRLSDYNSQTIEQDASGNTLNEGNRSFTYNTMNRMASVSIGGSTTSYRYNSSGQRITKTLESGEQIHFVYGLSGELLGEYTNSGQRIREYIYRQSTGLPLLVAQIEADGSITYLHTDHLGTPRYATNNSKALVWSWLSDGFGSTLPNEDVDGDGNLTTVNIRFPGQYFDSESGLHYNYYRDYDPRTGRYIQSDPIGLDGGLNTYAYVDGNPLSYIDPLGLCRGCRQGQPNARRPSWEPAVTGQARSLIREIQRYESGFRYETVSSNGVRYTNRDVRSLQETLTRHETSGSCPSPVNMSPWGAGRRGAFREAKRNEGIPVSQQPIGVRPNTDRRGNVQPGRQYDFIINGQTRTIREDSAGHFYGPNNSQNRGPHFNGSNNSHYDY